MVNASQGSVLYRSGSSGECQWVDDRGEGWCHCIHSAFGLWGGSGGGIVLFELLDGHIPQEFVDVGRKKDGARRLSGVGSASRR